MSTGTVAHGGRTGSGASAEERFEERRITFPNESESAANETTSSAQWLDFVLVPTVLTAPIPALSECTTLTRIVLVQVEAGDDVGRRAALE